MLLGEASHGTHEYYGWRSAVTRRLVEEAGFSFVAVEGDWPECRAVDRHVRGEADEDPTDVLRVFDRWPTWMWANHEVAGMLKWLRRANEHRPRQGRAGFYGLDVYSLWSSLGAILDHLRGRDDALVEAAERAFACFEPYAEDPQEYARATTALVPSSCEREVVELLAAFRRERAEAPEGEDAFDAEQNALVARNAEAYYRAMVRGGPASWNLRDVHMADTLDRLLEHHGPDAKGVVWAHNTHVGDARWTDMRDAGMTNLGELARERHGEERTFIVGFGSNRGGVIAGTAWGAPMRHMVVPPAREGSWEDVLHRTLGTDALLLSDELRTEGTLQPRDHRAIGVVYHPERERWGNYVPTVLPRRYDAFLYLDETQALRPLAPPALQEAEAPETYPTGY